MLNSDIPAKFQIPFANGAGPTYITNPIPQPSQSGGHASLNDGFPPICFTPTTAGGIPLWGADTNGILFQISAWARWQSAGGSVSYDATFSAGAGGYPKGALLASSILAGATYLSTADSNATDPETGGAGWTFQAPRVWEGTVWTDTGTPNAMVVTLSPAPASLAQMAGVRFCVRVAGTNTGATTLALNGLAAAAVVGLDGSALAGGQLIATAVAELVYDGTSFRVVSGLSRMAPSTTIINGQTGSGAATVTGSFTVPTGCHEVEVTVTAAGGPGAGCDGTYNGGSGGAGATGIKLFTGLTGGEIIYYSVGYGGIGGGPSIATPSASAGSSITYNSVLYACTPGADGIHGSSSSGGAGGTASGFDINIGGGAGSDSPASPSVLVGGLAGASYWGGGGRSSTATSFIQAGRAPGSGGGGSYSSTIVTGGNPAPGVIVFKCR